MGADPRLATLPRTYLSRKWKALGCKPRRAITTQTRTPYIPSTPHGETRACLSQLHLPLISCFTVSNERVMLLLALPLLALGPGGECRR